MSRGDTRPGPDSPVFQAASLPQVGRARSSMPVMLALGAAALLGMLVFAGMSGSRRPGAAPPPPAVGQPPPLNIAPYAPPPPPPVTVAQPPPTTGGAAAAPTAPAPVSVAHADPQADRRRAPTIVVDFSEAAAARPGAGAGGAPVGAADEKLSAEERFAARVTGVGADTARASRLRDLSRIAPQGTTIPAVLETAINSDLPGAVRAVVSRDVRGFDGQMVLIPRGSKLIGQYRSGVAAGQTRAFVVWSRVLTPEGVSIEIGSPGADRLGRGGLDGETDSHFFRRFGAAILLSVLGAGLDAAAGHNGDVNALIIGSPQQASRVAEIALQKQIDIAPTIKVKQGTPLQVFVSRDLDFSGLSPAPR